MDSFLKESYNKYKKDLDGFIYITNENLNIIENGGIIKYIDLNGNLKYGGVLIKILDNDLNTTRKFLLKTGSSFYTLYHHKLYFFFKPVVKNTKRNILLTILSELK